MRINHNLMAMNTHRQLAINNTAGGKSIEKLSSGYRINRAGDDAAGLAISEKMRGQIRGLNQASRNAQDDISLIQTTEGALNETHAIIQRMREMAVQSSNDTNTDEDRQALQNEMDQLAEEITRISNSTEFNTRKLLNGNLDKNTSGSTGDLTFHIGANTSQNMRFAVKAMDAATLGVADTDLSGKVSAGKDIESVEVDKEPTGAQVVDGGRVIVSVGNKTAATDSTATVDGVTVTAKGDNAAAINDYTILVDATTGNTASSVIDHENKTITVKTDGAGLAATEFTVIGVEPEGIDFTFSGTAGTADAVSTGVMAAGTVATVDVTFIGTGGTTDTVTGVKVTAEEIDGANDFAGMTLKTDGLFDEKSKAVVDLGKSTVTTFKGEGKVDQEAKVSKGIDITTQAAADRAITKIDSALKLVSDQRAELGAVQNRLEHTIKNVDTSSENLQASEARIRDVDMAKEMMEFTKNNILQQAAQSMLAQANQAPQGVLQLLR